MNRRSPTMIVLLVALLGSAGAWYLQDADREEASAAWEGVEPMPTARSEMPAALLEGIVYVPGGLGDSRRTLTTFEAYDVGADEWKVLEPLPLPLHHTGAAAAGGRVLVAGGYSSLEFRTDNASAWAFDPSTGRWSRAADLPAPRAAHALVESGGLVYVVGGVGPRSEELWAYDPVADSWVTGLAPIPTAREHLTAVALDGRLYAIGGRVGGRNLATVEVYETETDSWAPAPDMPTPRSGLSAAVVAREIHVAGGEELSGGGTFDEHEIFDPETGEWRAGSPLSVARHGLASVGIEGGWYLIGGATGAGAETFATLTDLVELLEVAVPR